MYKNLITILLAALFGANLFADIAISEVKVFSGYPWKEVILGYKITGSTDQPINLQVRAKDNETDRVYDCVCLVGVDLSEGNHTLKWNADADGAKFASSNVVFTMRIIRPTYCVIDLAGGATAANYPVAYLEDVPAGGWTDEYKSTKLVLRRCSAGSDPLNRYILTKDFYAGVFEVTEKQWQLVMDATPSYSKRGGTYPVECVSYNDIRGSSLGSSWPSSSSVDASSFIGKLRSKTGLSELDLPTEAQWEYACRAGTTTTYNTGDSESALASAGWYKGNSNSQKYPVGQKTANAWGLYDMHGNVWEWCLDRFDWDYWNGFLSGDDPVGGASGSGRRHRGGSWNYDASCATASCRNCGISYPPQGRNNDLGFRLFRTLP